MYNNFKGRDKIMCLAQKEYPELNDDELSKLVDSQYSMATILFNRWWEEEKNKIKNYEKI